MQAKKLYAFTSSAYKPTLKAESRLETFLSHFVRWSWIVLLAFSLLQLVLHWSLTNAIAVGFVVLGWFIFAKLFLRQGVLISYPLSSFLVFGFTITQFYFPLVFTLLEGKALIFNLDLPVEVFLHSLASLIMLVLAHLIYRFIGKNSKKKPPSLLIKAGFFQAPRERQLWLMGLVGLAAMFYIYFYSPSVGRDATGAVDKFIHGLIAFSYAPFFIPFGRLFGHKEINLKRVVPLLIAFVVLLFVVSIGRNSRGAFMFGLASVGFAWGFGLLLGIFKTRLFSFRNIVLGVFALWFLTGPLVDIGTAMVIVRSQRNVISRSELVSLTLEAYQDKEAIQAYRRAGLSEERAWDEHYMDNLFLARFSNLKFNDISLLEASKISPVDNSMFHFTMDRFWATLPQPALSALGLEVNKLRVTSFSFGDYLFYKAGADDSVLGSYRTGHFAGTGMAAFGLWYLLILGLGMLPVFFLYDKLFFQRRVPVFPGAREYIKIPHFSFCGLLGLTSIFMFLPAESVMEPYTFLIRGFLQMLLLYFLVFHFTRFLSMFVPGTDILKKKRGRRNLSYKREYAGTSKLYKTN